MTPRFRSVAFYGVGLGACAMLGCPALPNDSRLPAEIEDSGACSDAESDADAAMDSWFDCADDSEGCESDPVAPGDGDSASRAPLGQICSSSDACASDYCVDGVCCGSDSCPTCQVCASAGACVPQDVGTSCTTPNAEVSTCNGQGVCVEQSCSPGYLEPLNVATAVCSPSSGGCTYTTCLPFDDYGNLYLDCDGNGANGCETAPSSQAHCGSCQHACGSNFFCGQSTPGVYVCVHD
jgi:hypothetical protein